MRLQSYQIFSSILCFSLLYCGAAHAIPSIEEKRALLQSEKKGEDLDEALTRVNTKLPELKKMLKEKYSRVSAIFESGAEEEEYKAVLADIQSIKSEIRKVEVDWKEVSLEDSKRSEEGYGLWDLEETTLSQLVMEYGAMDYLYIIPPEMTGLKLSMHSSIPIPRESWTDVLEIVLSQNGIGVKKLNPFARQLYILKQNLASVQAIISRESDLQYVPAGARVFFLLSPPVEQAKSAFQFIERFCDTKQAFVYLVGSKVAIVSNKEEVEKLNALYQAVWSGQQGKISKVVSMSKMTSREMEKVLTAFFNDGDKGRIPFGKTQTDRLSVFALAEGNSLVLIGPKEIVDRAEKLVKETEEQLKDPLEMTVNLYTCRHSDPEKLAETLEKVYSSLLTVSSEKENVDVSYSTNAAPHIHHDGYEPAPPLVVAPTGLNQNTVSKLEVEKGYNHFIPDPKTGGLLMVIRRDAYPKIKELLAKLDVPKRMVQIEVLLFEKKLSSQSAFGMNLLKLGETRNTVTYSGLSAPTGKGVLAFFFQGSESKYFPNFELAYSFLMTQDDIQLNSAPSVVTVNQTPATIAIVEEMSIDNGAAPIDTNKGTAFQKSFSRAQYGTTIKLTPTVHMGLDGCEDERDGFITLQTNISFDTTRDSSNDRPLVDRRHIENEVRVRDGETVIIGGLRKKSKLDRQEKVPFLGEIPGIGRLFGSTRIITDHTEMFFFITPKIILDPKAEMEQLRTEQLKKRPGEIPEFLQRLEESRQSEKKKFFRQTMQMFFSS